MKRMPQHFQSHSGQARLDQLMAQNEGAYLREMEYEIGSHRYRLITLRRC